MDEKTKGNVRLILHELLDNLYTDDKLRELYFVKDTKLLKHACYEEFIDVIAKRWHLEEKEANDLAVNVLKTWCHEHKDDSPQEILMKRFLDNIIRRQLNEMNNRVHDIVVSDGKNGEMKADITIR